MLNPSEMTRTSSSKGELVRELGVETVRAVFFSSLDNYLVSYFKAVQEIPYLRF